MQLGGNRSECHLINVLPGRDFSPAAYLDLRNVEKGDPCPHCRANSRKPEGLR